MRRYRSVLASILALVMAFVVGCSAPQVEVPKTYTQAQLQQIDKYNSDILGLRDRMTRELVSAIQNRKWTEVNNFIHGPLGTLLQEMNYLTRNLLPNEQPQARKLSREVFEHLVEVGDAANKGAVQEALASYGQALIDLDSFLKLVPKG